MDRSTKLDVGDLFGWPTSSGGKDTARRKAEEVLPALGGTATSIVCGEFAFPAVAIEGSTWLLLHFSGTDDLRPDYGIPLKPRWGSNPKAEPLFFDASDLNSGFQVRKEVEGESKLRGFRGAGAKIKAIKKAQMVAAELGGIPTFVESDSYFFPAVKPERHTTTLFALVCLGDSLTPRFDLAISVTFEWDKGQPVLVPIQGKG